MAQALAQCNFWGEAKVALKGGGISIGGRNITWLHGYELLVRIKVVVLRQDTGTEESLLQDIHEVKQALWLTATNWENFIRGNGQTVFASYLFWGLGHHSHNAFYNAVASMRIRENKQAGMVLIFQGRNSLPRADYILCML